MQAEVKDDDAADGAHSAAHIFGVPADSPFATEWFGVDDTGKDNSGAKDGDWMASGSDSDDAAAQPVKAHGRKMRPVGRGGGRGPNVFDHEQSPTEVRVSRARDRI